MAKDKSADCSLLLYCCMEDKRQHSGFHTEKTLIFPIHQSSQQSQDLKSGIVDMKFMLPLKWNYTSFCA